MLHACIAKEYSNGSTTVLLLKMYLYKEGCHWDLTTAEREKGRYSDGDGEGRGEEDTAMALWPCWSLPHWLSKRST
jgi:hypothetical protein